MIGLPTKPILEGAAKYALLLQHDLLRWQEDPGFQAEIRKPRHQAMERWVARLQQASPTAAKTLQKIMQEPKVFRRLTGDGRSPELGKTNRKNLCKRTNI